jgi:hypothetical protein
MSSIRFLLPVFRCLRALQAWMLTHVGHSGLGSVVLICTPLGVMIQHRRHH